MQRVEYIFGQDGLNVASMLRSWVTQGWRVAHVLTMNGGVVVVLEPQTHDAHMAGGG